MDHTLRLACVVAGTAAGIGPTSADGQRVDPGIRNALLAQVVGPGGCADLTSIRGTTNRFFPEVQFFEATCTAEHGDLVQPLAARDSAGLVFLLNSVDGFGFLLLQHPPVGLDSSTTLEYVRGALIMMGKVPAFARIAAEPNQVPADLCRGTGLVCTGLFRTRVERGGLLVFLTAFTANAIYSAGPVVVNLRSGHVVAAVQVDWDSTRVH
jgi:hypothetical protein